MHNIGSECPVFIFRSRRLVGKLNLQSMFPEPLFFSPVDLPGSSLSHYLQHLCLSKKVKQLWGTNFREVTHNLGKYYEVDPSPPTYLIGADVCWNPKSASVTCSLSFAGCSTCDYSSLPYPNFICFHLIGWLQARLFKKAVKSTVNYCASCCRILKMFSRMPPGLFHVPHHVRLFFKGIDVFCFLKRPS